MIANVLINKKFQPIVSKLFIRDRTLRISINLIWESYFSLPKNILYVHMKMFGFYPFMHNVAKCPNIL